MSSDCEEPASLCRTAHGGPLAVQSQPSSGKPSRPYAGADDSMDELLGTTNTAHSLSPSKMPKPELLVGDLVWSKIPGHAWWPSMVSYEPNKAVYFQSSGRGKTCFKYHVQFFGDEPQRGWVSDKNMIKFTGRDPFMELPTSVVSKRDKIPHSKQLRAWERALEQAQKALPLNRQQRKLCYVFKYNDDLQRGPKPNKSPELTWKKKEKPPTKKLTKVRARVTRRSCLLEKSNEKLIGNDFGESVLDSVNVNSSVGALSIDGKALTESTLDEVDVSTQSSDAKGNSEKATLRRRGRSAGSYSIESNFVLDTVHVGMRGKLKDGKTDDVIMSFQKEEFMGDELQAKDEIMDVKMADGKFSLEEMTTSYSKKGQGISRKRQTGSDEDNLIKPPKKIKVEIVTRKPHIFEIMPKKMKNKQTQTPERKTKKGVTVKKRTKRKIDFDKKAIKTKETSASKKFSRKLKAPCKKGGRNRKGFVDGNNKKKGEKVSNVGVAKQILKERTGTKKLQCKLIGNDFPVDSAASCNEGSDCEKGTNDVSINDHRESLETNLTSVMNESEVVPKRKRGRPRSKAKTNELYVEKPCFADPVLSQNTTELIGLEENGEETVASSPEKDTQEIQGSVSAQQTAGKSSKSERDRCRTATRETRQLRGSKNSTVILPDELTSDKSPKKPRKPPSRRSTRHLVTPKDIDSDSVVKCKVSQLPEIDDIVDGDNENSSRINGMSGRINKGLLLEVLNNIDKEIPIEVEGIEERDREAAIENEDACEKSVDDEDGALLSHYSSSEMCPESVSLSKVVESEKASEDCSHETSEDESEGLAMYAMNGQLVEDYMQVKSDENLAVCSVIGTVDKHGNHENDDFAVSWTTYQKALAKSTHIDTSCKTYERVSSDSDVRDRRLIDANETDSGMGDSQAHSSPAVTTLIEPSSQIESPCTSVDASRRYDQSHHLEGLLNDGGNHEYCNPVPGQNNAASIYVGQDDGFCHQNTVQSNNTSVFASGGLNGVEDADLFLNDDDVGLPASKDDRSCIFAKCGTETFATTYCKEIEPLNMLGKVTGSEPIFGKSTQIDVNGLDEFHLAIPSLTIPDFTQSVPFYQKRLDNSCAVIPTLSNASMHIDHISSRYFHGSDALSANPVASGSDNQIAPLAHSDTNTQAAPSHHLGRDARYVEHSLGHASEHGILGSGHAAYRMVDEANCDADVNDGTVVERPCIGQVRRQSSSFEDVTAEIDRPSADPLQERGIRHYESGRNELGEDKNTMLPIVGMLQRIAESQATGLECSDERNHKEEEEALTDRDNPTSKPESVDPMPVKESPTHMQCLENLTTSIKKSPAMYESNCYPESSDVAGSDGTTIPEYVDNEKNETVDADSNTFSANSSISEMQSPCGMQETCNGDSSKISDDVSPAGNLAKRQRKRKAMSDFHVGLAFDEILSNRSRSSEGDKGTSKLSLTKKKRDGVRRIDFEEKSPEKLRSTKDAEAFESIKDDCISEGSQIEENVEEEKRHKKKNGALSGEHIEDVSVPDTICNHGKSPIKDGGEIAVEASADVSSFDAAEVTCPGAAGITEKKKRGRRPKSKKMNNDVSKSPMNKKPKALPKKATKTKVADEGTKDVRKRLTTPKKKTSLKIKRTTKVKIQPDEKKVKRKYVRRKEINTRKLPQNGDLSEAQALSTTDQNTSFVANEIKAFSKDGFEKETKPKRRYNKKKKPADVVVGKSDGKNDGKNDSVDKKGKKSKKKRKQTAQTESLNSNTANDVLNEKQLKRKERLDGESDPKDGEVFVEPKKSKKKKSSAMVVNNKNGGGKKRKTSEKSLIDGVSTDRTTVSGDEQSMHEIAGHSNVEGDANFERPVLLPGLDAKKSKRNEKLETRSNVSSDEVASISGRDNDDSVKSKKESICTICEQSDGLLACNGVCYSSFHPDCLGLSTVPDKFYCDECLTGNHSCFLCKETGSLRKCSYSTCGKFYHEDCTRKLRGFKFENSKLTCSLHNCGTCTKEKDNANTSKKRLLRCVRCPIAYHATGCLVAGCMQLTNTLMVCNKHFVPHKNKPHHTHYNVSWCFVCSTGGMLVCCDSCPAAFHPGCVEELNGVPDEAWQCDSCREGRKPLYGDLVWVKYGFWRWWPARICLPDEIPSRIQNLPHDVGEFPVMFFGSRDYCWLHAGRVFPYQEGDKGCRGNSKNGTNKIFEKAIREVEEAHKELKEMQDKQMEQRLAKQSKKPPPYKQIKVNKYISALRNVIDPSEFTHCECSPTCDNPCGPGSECINRMLQIECDKTCKAQDNCRNQRFQKCQQVDCVPFKTVQCGWGLKTRQDIKKGDFVIEYVGELIDEVACRKRINEYHDQGISDYYFLVIDKDNIIDAYPKGNASRFMNHCCDPNCDTQKWTVNGEIRVGLFANKDVEAGSELTFNYNLDTLGNEKKACQCGSKNCSGFLGVRPKTQTALALKEKKKKEKQKKKKKKDKTKLIRHEDECFACGDGGELIMCDRTSCSKCYHLKCLTLSDMPKGKWDCPWHFCDICGKRASYYCSICPNSFCGTHREGEVVELSEGVYVCDEHSQDEIKNEKNRLVVLSKSKEDLPSERGHGSESSPGKM